MTLQELLLKIARASIEEKFGKPFPYSKEILLEQFPELSEERATFVTINIDGDSLRGCIGSLLPHATLFDDIVYNARSAAFGDSRFFPLSEAEYPYCSIEISLLNIPEELSYSDAKDLQSKIRPGIDGVILQLGKHNATFLPQIWEKFPSFEHFFGQLGIKASINTYVLNEHPTIYTYQVERFEDTSLEETYEDSATTLFSTPQAAEAGFYGALGRGDLKAMLRVWADDDAVTCIHPGGERLQGRAAIEQSWRDMLTGQPSMHFETEEVHITQDKQFSIHTLRERITVNGQLAGVALTTNVYRLLDGGWHLLIHHTSPDPAAF